MNLTQTLSTNASEFVRRNSTASRRPPLPSVEFRLAFGVALALVSLISFSGSVFTLYVVIKRALYKKTIWLYLVALSLADIGMSTLHTPIWVAFSVNPKLHALKWLFPALTCTYIVFSYYSICATAAIALHKYNLVRKPFQSLHGLQCCGFLAYIAVATTLSTLFVAMFLWGFLARARIGYIIFGVGILFGYTIPFFIMTVCSFRTYRSVREQQKERKAILNRTLSVEEGENKRMVKMLLTICIAFFIFWTPNALLFILNTCNVKVPVILWYFSCLFVFIQGCVNPVIYSFQHPVFKLEAKSIFRICVKYEDDNVVNEQTVTLNSMMSVHHC